MATSLLAAWKLNHLSEVPKCHCQCAPVVQVVVDDEGRVVEAGEQVRHGGGARLVAPAEGQPVQRRVKEVPRLGQRALSLVEGCNFVYLHTTPQYLHMNSTNNKYKYVPSYLHRILYKWDL